MKFLADENIPIKVCNRLRQEDVDIISILEIAKGAKDEEVISLAKSENRIIITFDKDFGELVFRKRTKVNGIREYLYKSSFRYRRCCHSKTYS